MRGGELPRPSVPERGDSVNDLYSPSTFPLDSGPGIKGSSLSAGNVPVSLSVDPPPEGLEPEGTVRRKYGAPLFGSLFIHSVILLLLLAVMHQPDRRPVKEVNHWVINLVSAVKEVPQGPQTVLPEESHFLAGPIRSIPHPQPPVSTAKKALPDDRSLDFHESPPAPSVFPERPALEPFPSPFPLEGKDVEGALLAMQESANQQMQMGQYIFRMRMGDRMVGVKMKYFQQNAGATLNGLIGDALPLETLKGFQGKSITLRILYREDGTLQDISVEPASEGVDLAQILKEKIPWETMNSPRKFGLPFQELKVRVSIDPEGKPLSRISLL